MMHHSNDNHPIRFLSVCSGIEAASVAWSPLGWEAVAFGEIDKGASAVLAYRHPHVPNLGDFTQINVSTLGRVDILCGGTPCQAFSVAGARRGLDDARGNLSLAFVGLAHELADNNGLRNAVWENVPGVLTMADNAFGCFLGGLVGADGPFVPVEPKPADRKSTRWWRWSAKDKCHAVRWPKHGMVSGPKGRAAWAVKDAQYFGLAQRRERVLVVADFGIGADPAAVLFERVSVPWNPPARGEKREGAAGATSLGFGGNRTSGPIDVAAALNAHGGPHGRLDFESETFVTQVVATLDASYGRLQGASGQDANHGHSHLVPATAYSIMPQNSGKDYKARVVEVAQPLMAGGPVGGNQGGDFIVEPVCVTGTVTHTLKAEGADASEDGTGRGTPIIAFDCKGTQVAFTTDGTMTTLRSMAHSGSHQNAGGHAAIAFVQNSRDEVRLQGGDGQIVGALAAEPGMKQQTFLAQTVALRGREGGATAELGGEVATALRASSGGGDKPHVLTSAVRRLTPRECERLQGFPDDYTRIPIKQYGKPKYTKNRPPDMWEEIDGKWWLMAADGPRYKQLGNSWAAPKFRWLGERIQRLMPQREAANDNNQQLGIRRAG